jgi:predicted MFS family arabinose efflux permease
MFAKPDFRAASFGYFGHMWELYAFWVFVPFMIAAYEQAYPQFSFNNALLSFLVIAVGGLACVCSGYLSQRFVAKKVAFVCLLLSGICCLISPVIFSFPSVTLFVSFLICWGIVVVADSPLFSTLVAQNAPSESKGSALTIVTCIGFSITIVSIQFVNLLYPYVNIKYVFMLLAIGPVIGLIALSNRGVKG